MTFQLKDFKSIVAAMINYSKATQDTLTDFHVGSVTRTLFEAPAIEIDEFYQQVFFGLLDAIPVAVYKAFGFERLPAACASGTVRFSLASVSSSDVTIPAGTVVTSSSDESAYATSEEAVIEAGSLSVDIRVTATATGTAYNKGTGEVDQLESSVESIETAVSITAMTGGRDEESDDELKKRFTEYIEALSKSTVKAVLYGVKQAVVRDEDGTVTEYVAQAGIEESPGIVNLYIYGSGGLPTADLIENAQVIIDGTYDPETGIYVEGYRPTGVGVFVSAMTERSVAFTLSVRMSDATLQTDAKKAEIKAVIDNILGMTNIGETVSMADIKTAVLGIDGVIQVSIENSENITRASNEVLMTGTCTVSWL